MIARILTGPDAQGNRPRRLIHSFSPEPDGQIIRIHAPLCIFAGDVAQPRQFHVLSSDFCGPRILVMMAM